MESQLQQLQQMQQMQQMQEQQQQPQGNRNQQQQQQQQQQPKHFIPIQSERVISPSGGVMIRHATNKTHLTANAVIGISVPHNSHNNLNSMVVPITEPSEPEPTATASAPTATASAPTTTTTTSATTTTPVPLVGMVQDVIFSMILNVPALRTKLQVILDNPSLIGDEISKVYAELQSKLTPQEMQQLNAYAGQDSSRRTLGSVMQTAFANIMADGKIDMSDAPHFLTLIHDCITLFSENAAAASVTLNSNTVITFLHFVLKCILILTLDEPEETAALVMLDGSFRLVKLTVLPLISGKKWCCCFS
jgi:hypothetical protein